MKKAVEELGPDRVTYFETDPNIVKLDLPIIDGRVTGRLSMIPDSEGNPSYQLMYKNNSLVDTGRTYIGYPVWAHQEKDGTCTAMILAKVQEVIDDEGETITSYEAYQVAEEA